MPPKLSLPPKRGLFFSFRITPSVRVIARQPETGIVSRHFLPRDIKMSLLAHWEAIVVLRTMNSYALNAMIARLQ